MNLKDEILNDIKENEKQKEESKIVAVAVGKDGDFVEISNDYFKDFNRDFNEKYSYNQIGIITNSIKSIHFKLLHNNDIHTKFISVSINPYLVYDINDFTEDNKLKDGATPLSNIIYYKKIDTYNFTYGDNKSVSDDYKGSYNYSQGIRFDVLRLALEANNLSYEGPETFELLKEKITNGEDVTMTFSLDLVKLLESDVAKEIETVETTVETKESNISQEPVLVKKRSIFRRK